MSMEEIFVDEGQPIPLWMTYHKFWANEYKDLLIGSLWKIFVVSAGVLQMHFAHVIRNRASEMKS